MNSIRIRHVHIGGAFGGRSETFPTEFTAALLSMKSRRPVRIVRSREEMMTAIRHKHAVTVELKIGVKRDGTLIAIDSRVVLDGGAYMSTGPNETGTAAAVGRRYRIPNARGKALRVYTNKTPCSIHRTHGSLLVLAVEMTLDRIAEDLGIDPVELRLRHARQAALGETINKVVAASDWRQKKGKLPPGRGIGLACGASVSGIPLGFRQNSAALIKFNEDGSCTLFTGLVDNGQGNESMVVQIAAEAIGIPVKDIALVCGDTELTPQDPGSYSMSSAWGSGNAVLLAGLDARQQIMKIAGENMGIPVAELEVKDSLVFAKGEPEKAMRVADVAKLAFASGNTILGRGAFTYPQPGANTDGTNVAEVAVDRETGVVKVLNMVQAYDCGYALNPMAVEGQFEGAAVQMMGEALYEKHVWDEKNGRVITDSFLDYRIPTSLDAPNIRQPIIVESIDPVGPFGAKEVGINGSNGVVAAIVNAIYDAIGVRIKDIPVTPEKILAALEEKERQKVT